MSESKMLQSLRKHLAETPREQLDKEYEEIMAKLFGDEEETGYDERITKEWLESKGFTQGYTNLDPEYRFENDNCAIAITLRPGCDRAAQLFVWNKKTNMHIDYCFDGRSVLKFTEAHNEFTFSDLYEIINFLNISADFLFENE